MDNTEAASRVATSYDKYEQAQGWDEGAFGTCSSAQAAYFDEEVARLPFAQPSVLRVLDVGFGNGPFLGWCRTRGWLCEGLEVNPRLVQRAVEHGFTAAESIDRLPSSSPYDLITAFDVLEHIERDALVPFFVSLRHVCGPRSLLLLRFPNGDNPFSLPIQNGDWTHRTAIGQSMLRQVASLSDFEVVTLGSPGQSMGGATLSRRAAVAAGLPVRWLIGKLIRHLFMGGMPVTFSANLVAVLRRTA